MKIAPFAVSLALLPALVACGDSGSSTKNPTTNTPAGLGTNPCGTCPAETYCSYGQCVGDPCRSARCPAGERCVVQNGQAQCEADWSEVPEPDAGALDATPPVVVQPDAALPDATPRDLSFDQRDALVESDKPTSSGGCAIDRRAPAPWALLLLLGLPLVLRRRRNDR